MCQVIEDFKRSLIEDEKSSKTIKSYIGDIRAFIEFIKSKGVKLDLADEIKEYIKDRDYSLKDSEYLIIGQRGALKRDAINTMLERLTDEIGMVNKLKPHTFTHTYFTKKMWRMP